MKTPDSSPSSIWNRRVVLLFAATFLAYANISVFFYFYGYLKTLPIAPERFGLIISTFSAVSLLIRPAVTPFFHSGNARRFILIGTIMVIGSLSAYSAAQGFWSMMGIRSLHALAFVILGAALMTLIIDYIPGDRSTQFFGLMAIVILIPNTLIPPMLPFLTDSLGGFTRVLVLFAGVTVFVVPLVLFLGPPEGGEENGSNPGRRLTGSDILRDVKNPGILFILTAMLFLYSGHALVFFFLDAFGREINIAGTGFFLTLTTVGEIGVRLAAGSAFDRSDKVRIAALTMIGLACCYTVLSFCHQEILFFSLALLIGLGWGVAMPVFNGLMFDISAPAYRAFNTNLGLQMFQAGFFLGPFIGGPVAAQYGAAPIFLICAALGLLSSFFAWGLKGRIRTGETGEEGKEEREKRKESVGS